MKLKLPATVYSPQDVDELLLQVREYAGWHSHNQVKKQAGAQSSDAPELSPDALATIRGWHGSKDPTSKSLDDLISGLEELKEQAPRIFITLAAPAGKKLKVELTEWCRSNLRPDTLVEFSFDSGLLGGMVVRRGSHIHDWSFRRQILENRRHFPEVLRRV